MDLLIWLGIAFFVCGSVATYLAIQFKRLSDEMTRLRSELVASRNQNKELKMSLDQCMKRG
jgi:hypothetical protein